MPYTHHKVGNKQCVYKKDTGKKVGCTKGPVKKYLAALHANVKSEKKKPTRKKFKDFYEMQMSTLGSVSRNVGDFSHVAETMYSDGQDETIPAVQPLADAVNREDVIKDIISDLEEMETAHDWSKPVNDDILQAMADTLKEVDIEPTDITASIGKPVELQRRFLIDGPSSWKGGNGALNDLRNILQGNEPQEIVNEQEELTPQDIHNLADRRNINWDKDPAFMKLTQKLTGKKHLDDLNQNELRKMKDYLEGLQEDESNPASDLPMGSTSAGDALSEGVYKLSKSFQDLPDTAPYGFWITSNGNYIIVNKMFGHDEALQELFPQIINKGDSLKATTNNLQNAMKAGMIRVVKTSGTQYSLTYHPLFLKGNAAKKTAKDIAEFYNYTIQDDFEMYDENNQKGMYKVGEVIFDNPFGTGRKHYPGIDKIEASSEKDALNKYVRRLAVQKNIRINPAILYRDAEKNGVKVSKLEVLPDKDKQYWWNDFDESFKHITENFLDKKGPGKPGDSKRHGIKKGSSLASLDRIVKSKTASPRKKQLAHWQANMRRGKAKKSR